MSNKYVESETNNKVEKITTLIEINKIKKHQIKKEVGIIC